MWRAFFVTLILALTPHTILSVELRDLETVYEWKQMVYGFATEEDRQDAIDNDNLVPENATPIDVAVDYHSEKGTRVFTTTPRFTGGIPYTLAVVTNKTEDNGPVLLPYPDYSWHNSNGSNCDKITSVYRVAITECNQMILVDTGVIDEIQHCPPQLLVIDLNTDTLSHRYVFDPSIYIDVASRFITPIAIVNDPPPTGNCSKVQVYMADVLYHGLVVYNSELDTAWRIENRFMYPDPDYGLLSIADEKFFLMDGLFGLASDGEQLYFHPLSTIYEYAVPLSVINNRTIFEEDVEAVPLAFRRVGERSSSCAAQAMDSQNNLYFVTFNPIKLTRWSPKKPYTPENELDIPADPQLIEFVSGMKVHKNKAGIEELWMTSNRFQQIARGTLDFSEVNFRLLRRPLDDIQNQSTSDESQSDSGSSSDESQSDSVSSSDESQSESESSSDES
ncbi:protein yellow isoform X3 [Bactrocera dorsalis]|uniref:Protein yellow isoform X3 n=1 Tax=Bactrocera dorsalis TaxID=27457 RepID=A0ABM3J3L1_BACDO|nr:protein yellow isoform X3 [Bactrocera dorsalis]XP_049303819.1 protein yellow isoform X3 [Bactrocera dorsalis]XP_049303820.1 protein yellow isoform X3 [Bactrocera dorsalis]XP_049303821.1 protein yellow isoform X3 [Bactrocera dorsalis]XP_049303822.1 protein yellow isoform X3 [Bactrocera dorsalis]